MYENAIGWRRSGNGAGRLVISVGTPSRSWAGLVFAGGGLVVTALTFRTGQQEVRTARENVAIAQQGQVTGRSTKAVEQLASGKREVRTAAVYALEQSPRTPSATGWPCATCWPPTSANTIPPPR